MHLGGTDSLAQLMHEPRYSCGRCVHMRILEVHVVRVRPEGDGECLRQHPEHAYAAHQVAVLKSARAIHCEVVSVQATSDAAADQGAVNCTRCWTRKRAKQQEAVIQLAHAEGKAI